MSCRSPPQGGDRQDAPFPRYARRIGKPSGSEPAQMVTRHRYYPISPLEGEMAGRPEGVPPPPMK
ncbi:hypothetical protein F4V91_05400 [Neorhizobium galegae]|uniref:Propionyl-coenzyme A carboxylase alpha polypeptide n=1 Tax=Neorhizobium galegae TaxID=399 RepID=A0A6A1U2Y5_NEOGA|nr:hypothetical protein F4V91_05400 [Neorhizobium galegae]